MKKPASAGFFMGEILVLAERQRDCAPCRV